MWVQYKTDTATHIFNTDTGLQFSGLTGGPDTVFVDSANHTIINMTGYAIENVPILLVRQYAAVVPVN